MLFGHVKGAFTGAVGSSEGLFTAAEGGTIFLDEIGDMSSDMQAKILRTLNNGEVIPLGGRAAVKVDVRVIAATNVDIEEAIRTRKFRSDLLHRINTMEINIWPLFLRPGDLPILVYYFIREWNNKGKGPEILAVTSRLLQQLFRLGSVEAWIRAQKSQECAEFAVEAYAFNDFIHLVPKAIDLV